MTNRYALLIANGEYTHMPTLKAPAQDAEALARILSDPNIGQFTEVTKLVDDPSPDNVRAAITHFFENKKPDDVLVAYFSGHGVVDENDDTLHLAVKETDPKSPYARGLEAQFLVRAMNPRRCRARTIVLIFDSCFSGAFDAGTKSAQEMTLHLKQFETEESGQGRVVITASTARQPAFDAGDGRAESLFTHHFIEGLESGQAAPEKEWTSVTAAYQYAYTKVRERQTPEISSYHQQGEIRLARNPNYRSTTPLSLNHHFLCYSPRDGADHAAHLHTALHAAGLRAWLDTQDTPAEFDPHAAREDALRECASVLLVLTPGSADSQGDSAREWHLALQYKKPVIPLRFTPGTHRPLQLGNRPLLDFAGPFDPALTALRQHLAALNTPTGLLHELEYRKADAEAELRFAKNEAQRQRILSDLERLEADIIQQREVARDPQAAARAAERRTEAALERERQPESPAGGRARAATKFINPPPLVAPTYFQDRHVENRLIADFLRDPAQRLLTVVGRGGVGKTALVCRLLKALENGYLPDDLGPLRVGGIVYLSAVGTHRVSYPNLFADLLQLLPAAQAHPLDALYKDPHATLQAQMTALCATFSHTDPILVLLDNLEDLLDPTTHAFTDPQVDAALRALLDAPAHPVKCLLTTRIPPREVLLTHPERQMTVPLDAGLPLKYAAEVLRAGDPLGVLGLKDAEDARLEPAVTFTRGYPRALEALTAALNADRAATLDDLLTGPPPANVVEALVGQAYTRLDPTSQKVMQALGIYARPVPAAAVDYLLQPHLPGLDSTPVLNRLVNMRFVTKEAGKYYMHPVDRAYALQRLPAETDEDREAAKQNKRSRDLFRFPDNPTSPQRPLSSSPSLPPTPPPPNAPTPTPSLLFTSSPLLKRAADYFAATRTPRASWKTLADLAPQLAEIDLRYAAGDYDTAAQVLTDIDFDYLLLWGHYRLMIEHHERLQGKLTDRTMKQFSVGNLGSAYYSIGQIPKTIACYEKALTFAQESKDKRNEGGWLGNLGNCYTALGQTRRAIEFHEQALAIAREIGDRRGEGQDLGNLGNCYANLGQTRRAIEFYEQALAIAREVGYRKGEGIRLGNLGNRYAELGQTRRAIEFYEQALVIAREIGDRGTEAGLLGNLGLCYPELGQPRRAIEYCEQSIALAREIGSKYFEGNGLAYLTMILLDESRYTEAIQQAVEAAKIGYEISNPEVDSEGNYVLALAHFHASDFPSARAATEQASQNDYPPNKHKVLALLGLIALRQNDLPAAREAFSAAVQHADALLALTPELYGALDAKALALAGLAALENLTGLRSSSVEELPEDLSGFVEEARAAWQAARAINSDAGYVRRAVRLLEQVEGVERFWESGEGR